jgi:hypothetical protein
MGSEFQTSADTPEEKASMATPLALGASAATPLLLYANVDTPLSTSGLATRGSEFQPSVVTPEEKVSVATPLTLGASVATPLLLYANVDTPLSEFQHPSVVIPGVRVTVVAIPWHPEVPVAIPGPQLTIPSPMMEINSSGSATKGSEFQPSVDTPEKKASVAIPLILGASVAIPLPLYANKDTMLSEFHHPVVTPGEKGECGHPIHPERKHGYPAPFQCQQGYPVRL